MVQKLGALETLSTLSAESLRCVRARVWCFVTCREFADCCSVGGWVRVFLIVDDGLLVGEVLVFCGYSCFVIRVFSLW